MFFGVNNCKNTKATKLIFVSKYSKFNVDSKSATTIGEKKFNSSDNCDNCPYYYENTCSWQSTC